jgi:hypothetical protein
MVGCTQKQRQQGKLTNGRIGSSSIAGATEKKNSDIMACEQWKEGREPLAGETDYQ